MVPREDLGAQLKFGKESLSVLNLRWQIYIQPEGVTGADRQLGRRAFASAKACPPYTPHQSKAGSMDWTSVCLLFGLGKFHRTPFFRSSCKNPGFFLSPVLTSLLEKGSKKSQAQVTYIIR